MAAGGGVCCASHHSLFAIVFVICDVFVIGYYLHRRREVMFYLLSVCMFVCLSARLLEKYEQTDVLRGEAWPKE